MLVMHICFILQMHTLAWLSGPGDSFFFFLKRFLGPGDSCVASKTMESDTSNSMPPTGQNPPHQAPATSVSPGLVTCLSRQPVGNP